MFVLFLFNSDFLILIIFTCLFSKEREKQGVDMGRWGGGEELGGVEEGKP